MRPKRPGIYVRVMRDGRQIASRYTHNVVTLQGLTRTVFGDRTQTNNFNLWYPLIFTAGAITINSTAQSNGVTTFFNHTKTFFAELSASEFSWFGSTVLDITGTGNIIGGALVSYAGLFPNSNPAVDQLWGGGNFSVPIPVAPGDSFEFSYLYNSRFQDNLGSIP